MVCSLDQVRCDLTIDLLWSLNLFFCLQLSKSAVDIIIPTHIAYRQNFKNMYVGSTRVQQFRFHTPARTGYSFQAQRNGHSTTKLMNGFC